ncbi:alpha/beta hydrolase [Actinoplanes sp. NPDC023714]|uniref:alpha/beta hydrolase n=1 Tax=Actinoplanes sp. NPDC023714 TaxID=3154322 RepID=UPI0033F924FA
MSAAIYARLRVTDPARWRAAALAWRRWAAMAGALGAEFGPLVARLRAAWSGPAVAAATNLIAGFRRRIAMFRVLCWRADQALSEFAAALARARELLGRARGRAGGAGLVIDDSGTVHGPSPDLPTVVADLSAALDVAARADAEAAARLESMARAADSPGGSASWSGVVSAGGSASGSGAGSLGRPGCADGPEVVRRWWDGLSPGERNRLLVTEPGWLASTGGIPVADRDLANRLLLDDHRARAADGARRGLRNGLDELSARLDDDAGLRPYLIGLDVSGDGRAVVALGDPDRARHVLTHVPGMTSDLESLGGELTRAGRVADRAAEVNPAEAASAVLWLDYDAPDFLHEAWSDRQAREGGEGLRRFQEELRATHDRTPAHLTVLGHSYGSVVVGAAAAGPLAADDVVFVGSPGVGVGSAGELTVPAGRVWATTSESDVIQYAAVSPRSLPHDLTVAGIPVAGPVLAFGRPERELWFGPNPSDPGFGGRVFASQADAGHLGYWDPGRPALDGLARIVTGQEPATVR